MDVIKPLDLTPLFDRTPHGPPIKLAIQRHYTVTIPPISLNGRLSTPIDPLTLFAVILLRYVQCTVFFVQCWYLVKS